MSTATIPRDPPPRARDLLRGVEDALRPHVRAARDTARRTVNASLGPTVKKLGAAVVAPLRRLGDLAERYVGAKIKRRVQPPIILALALGAVALLVGVVVLART